MENPDYALLDSVEVLKSSSQDYWLCNGTLLGIIRDKKLIPWDVDIDLGVLHENFSKDQAVSWFTRYGFELYDYGEGSDYITFKKYNAKVDINIYKEENGQYYSLWIIPNYSLIRRIINRLFMVANRTKLFRISLLGASSYSKEGYSIPVKYLLPLKSVEFYNKELSVPNESEKLLEWTYGADWQIPKAKYNWRTEGANNISG